MLDKNRLSKRVKTISKYLTIKLSGQKILQNYQNLLSINITVELEEINASYNKWIIGFRLKNKLLYGVWGADSTDNDDNKLWVDASQRIITFSNPLQTIEAVLTNSFPLFDSENMHAWASAILELSHIEKPDAVNNIDRISNGIKKIDFINLDANHPDFMLEIINFINLYGDYATQIKDKDYLKTWKKSSLHIFWEYMYNANFWTIPEEELKIRQKKLLRNYNAADCKEYLEKIMRIFVERIAVYS